MTDTLVTKPRRGRPPKNHDSGIDVRELLIRSGTEMFTEKGYMTSDINGILKKVGIPKGSFYYYFKSKEQFGLEIMRHYDSYFSHLLDKYLSDPASPPLTRLVRFYQSTKSAMEKYDWQRGCLVGNLGQEVTNLPDGYGGILKTIISGWQKKVEVCLSQAQALNDISALVDCRLMAVFFWMGWEGAVMQAKLARNGEPLDIFITIFINELIKNKA